MKSFVAYPLETDKTLQHDISEKSYSGKLLAHYELFKRVTDLEGSIVKCGISAESGVVDFASFRTLLSRQSSHNFIAFEKFTRSLFFDHANEAHGTLIYKIKGAAITPEMVREQLPAISGPENLQYIPGSIEDSIPEYLIQNPELKISFLNIDLDDYEATLTTLQFFYPRLVQGGILVFDSYYKGEEDYEAAVDYFRYDSILLNSFSVNKGPHYHVKQ